MPFDVTVTDGRLTLRLDPGDDPYGTFSFSGIRFKGADVPDLPALPPPGAGPARPEGARAMTPGSITGVATDEATEAALPGVTVTALVNGRSATTGERGTWALSVPGENVFGLAATAPGRVRTVLWLDTAWQRDRGSGAEHRLPAADGWAAEHEARFGVAPRPDRGLLLVYGVDDEHEPQGGLTIAIDAPHDGTFTADDDLAWVAATETHAADGVLAFPNVPAGTAPVSVTRPDGSPCEGLRSVPVEAGAVAVVTWRCGPPR